MMLNTSGKELAIRIAKTEFLTARVRRVIRNFPEQVMLEISARSHLDRKTLYKIKKGQEPVRRASILRLALTLEEMGKFGEMPYETAEDSAQEAKP